MKTLKCILFTGHRDTKINPVVLYELANKYHSWIWMHGNAQGFDKQVDKVAEEYGIQRIIVPPAYQHATDKSAPLRRNDVMLELCDVVIAFYDGRSYGGTYYTVNKARKLHKPVKIIK